MELKDRKLINNLPHYDIGTPGYAMLGATDPSSFFGLDNKSKTPNAVVSGNRGVSGTNTSTNNLKGYALGGIQLMNMGFLLANASKPDIDYNDLRAKYGTSQLQIGDTVYEVENNASYGREMSRIADESRALTMQIATTGATAGLAIGASLGSAGGPIGAAVGAVVGGIGGLIAGGAAKRKAREKLAAILKLSFIKNNAARDVAYSQDLNRKFAQEYGNQEDQLLYGHAKYGRVPDVSKLKDRKLVNNGGMPKFDEGTPQVNPLTRETYKNYLVDTAHGMAVDKQNAWGNLGEWILSGKDGSLHKILRGKGDTARLHLDPSDAIYSNSLINPATGNTIAKDVPMYAKLGMLPELLKTQASLTGRIENDNNILMKAKYGKLPHLPKFAKGAEWYTNFIPALTGTMAGWAQYNLAKNDDYDHSSTIPADTTAPLLRKLYDFRVNPMLAVHAAQRQAAATSHGIRLSGGLSVGQKLLANLGLDSQTQQNIAKIFLDANAKNQELQMNAVNSEIADRRERSKLIMQGNQYDRANAAAAHNARLQGMLTGIYNIQNALEQYFANEFKRKQFDENMDLYRLDNTIKGMYLNWLMNGHRNNTPSIIEPAQNNNLDNEMIYNNLAKHSNWDPYIPQSITAPDFASWDMNYLNKLYKKYNSKRRK